MQTTNNPSLKRDVLINIELGGNGIILPAVYIDPISPVRFLKHNPFFWKKILARDGSLEKITQYAIIEP